MTLEPVTPRLERLCRATVEIARHPELRQHFLGLGIDPASSSPAQFAAQIEADIPKWAKVIRLSGAKPD